MFGRRLGDLRLRRAPKAPRVVIDEGGGEVAVLIDYGQYVALLRVMASELGGRELPAYWRSAMEDCLAVRLGSVERH